jgi:hypothetical protein
MAWCLVKIIYIYVYIANTDKICDLLHDRPVLSSERKPHDKTATVLTTAKIWSRVPEGLSAKTGWLTDSLTDSLTISCKVTLTVTLSGSLHISKLHFSSSLIKLPISFFSNRKLRFVVEGGSLHASRYTSSAARFRPGPSPGQSLYKRHSENPRGLPSPLCRWHTRARVCVCVWRGEELPQPIG